MFQTQDNEAQFCRLQEQDAVVDGPQPVVIAVGLQATEDASGERRAADNIGIRFEQAVRLHQLYDRANVADRRFGPGVFGSSLPTGCINSAMPTVL